MAINTYNESLLHAALKNWYAGADAEFEVPLEGFVVDIVEDGVLVEIQTQNFSTIRAKLETLVPLHPVRLVYPIPTEKWIVKREGDSVSRRKSPRRGILEHVFAELVSIPRLLSHANFTLDVLQTQIEEERVVTRRRRKGWERVERKLLAVLGHKLFLTPNDMAPLLPTSLPDSFTTRDIAQAKSVPLQVAQKMVYCFRSMELVHAVGKKRQSILYERLN